VPAPANRRFRFAEFEIHGDALELRRKGSHVRLQIQPFRVLELLAERAGEVVTRDELRARVWPSNVYVDFDHGLNNAIARLREALGDSGDERRFIETIPRVGYRFVHPVEPIPGGPDGSASAVPVESSPAATDEAGREAGRPDQQEAVDITPATGTGRRIRWAVAGLLVIALVAAGIFALNRFGGRHAASASIRSIAVLPFRDLSEGGKQEHLAAGMTEALITRLAQDPSLRVVSRRSGEKYRDAQKSVAEISRELQVDGVIDGSIARQDDDLRIDVQVVRAADDSHLWARSYERPMADIFLVQRELAEDISREISPGVGGTTTAQVSVARSNNLEAYELYLQGRHSQSQRNPQSATRSVEYFERAIRLDPEFAAAYAGLAEVYSGLGGTSLVRSTSAETVRPAAMAAARRAIELDNGLAEAHRAMAKVLSGLFPRSIQTDLEIEREYLLALRLDPASAGTRHGYGTFLANRRRTDEAIAQLRAALRHDPLSPNIMGYLGMELAGNGQLEEGMKLMERAVEIEPWQFNAQLRLGMAYAAFDRYEEAQRAFALAERISPGTPQVLAWQSYVAARTGDVARATAALAELEAAASAMDAPFLVAIVYVGLKDRDGALKWLERALVQATPASNLLIRRTYYGLDRPMYDWLRDDPRFERIRRLAQGSIPDAES
jgi:TolB-like protein/DNA-binding winged helix-turn-helix (wHTH) protein/tetratricopeptide (TPR) repeat protein